MFFDIYIGRENILLKALKTEQRQYIMLPFALTPIKASCFVAYMARL